MSDIPPPLPPPQPAHPKPSMKAAWLSWIIACTVLPALPFLLLGKEALDGPACAILVLLAIAVQIGCSIWVPVILAKRSGRGPGFVIGISFALMAASVAV